MTDQERAEEANEYQPRTTERLVEILTAKGINPRSWEAEAARALTASEKRAAEAERDEARIELKVTEGRRFEQMSDVINEAGENLLRDYHAALASLTKAEKRASEAERTFADLRNVIAVNLALNAELVRHAEEAERSVSEGCDLLMAKQREMNAIQSERDEAVRRAEEAVNEARALAGAHEYADHYEREFHKAESERDSARASVRIYNDVVPVLTAERDEARAALEVALNARVQDQESIHLLEADCDSARAALGKVVEARDEAHRLLASIRPYLVMIQTSKDLKAAHIYIEAIDTALTHTGKEPKE